VRDRTGINISNQIIKKNCFGKSRIKRYFKHPPAAEEYIRPSGPDSSLENVDVCGRCCVIEEFPHHNNTSDVFSPEHQAELSWCIRFSAEVIVNTSSNMRLHAAFAMHLVGICPNIT
jgi:hypothetical protein